MEKNAIAQFKLKNGTDVFFEVPTPTGKKAIQPVGTGIGDKIYQVADGAAGTFEQALEKVKPIAETVMEKLVGGLTTPADEVEVKFGLNLTADAGVVFSSVGGEVSFEVTLKWQQHPTDPSN